MCSQKYLRKERSEAKIKIYSYNYTRFGYILLCISLLSTEIGRWEEMFGAAPPTSSNYVSSYFISTSHFLTSPEVEHCFISNTHIILISTYNMKDLANIRRCTTWTHLTFLG